MELSELTKLIPKRKRSAIRVDCRPNYKLFYNKYPHAIRITLEVGDVFNTSSTKQCIQFKETLKDTLDADEYKVRHEWYCYSIFCKDIEKTLKALNPVIGTAVKEILIEQMSEDIHEVSSISPKLPRAVTVVVKKLPYDLYRYKVYWPSTSNKMAAIGQHSLEAITAQINSFPGCRPIKQKIVNQIHKMGYQWHGRYFYTESEDIFSIISLINPSFISRIEKFVTIEEVNAEKLS